MKTLVTYATKAGSTKEIAEFIGRKLADGGIPADVLNVSSVSDPAQYDAFVIGSAVYMFHWMKEARAFVLRNRSILSSKAVWLFSSGPVGNLQTDSKGRDLRDASVSGPKEIDELMQAAKPREHRVFFGAIYSDKLGGTMGLAYRVMRRSKSVRESMPDGDYRDWKSIGDWAVGIAAALSPHPVDASRA